MGQNSKPFARALALAGLISGLQEKLTGLALMSALNGLPPYQSRGKSKGRSKGGRRSHCNSSTNFKPNGAQECLRRWLGGFRGLKRQYVTTLQLSPTLKMPFFDESTRFGL